MDQYKAVQATIPGQVYTLARNTLIVMVIKRVVEQAAGHCVAELLCLLPASSINLKNSRQCQPEATESLGARKRFIRAKGLQLIYAFQ